MSAPRVEPTSVLVAIAAGLIALASTARAQPQCGPESVTAFGQWFAPGTVLSASNPTRRVRHGIADFAAESVRLLIGVTAGTDRDWNLVIRDTSYRVLASFGAEDFRDERGGLGRRRWTGRLPAAEVIADLVASPTSDVRIEISTGMALPKQSADTRLFSIVRDDGEPWSELYERNQDVTPKRAGDAVGMLVSGAISAQTGEKRTWCCSGVMLSSDVMLTNWHCGGSSEIQMTPGNYWNEDVCDNTVVDLGWGKGAVSRQYNCVKVLKRDRRLDFALLRLRPVIGAGGTSGEPSRVRLSERAVESGQDVFVVHHAQCKEKLVSARCRVVLPSYPGWKASEAAGSANSQPQTEFSHDCNTEQGASGAPVFDTGGKLVGLHHVGFARDNQCRPVDRVNKAVKVRDIVKFLRDSDPDLAKELHLN